MGCKDCNNYLKLFPEPLDDNSILPNNMNRNLEPPVLLLDTNQFQIDTLNLPQGKGKFIP